MDLCVGPVEEELGVGVEDGVRYPGGGGGGGERGGGVLGEGEGGLGCVVGGLDGGPEG